MWYSTNRLLNIAQHFLRVSLRRHIPKVPTYATTLTPLSRLTAKSPPLASTGYFAGSSTSINFSNVRYSGMFQSLSVRTQSEVSSIRPRGEGHPDGPLNRFSSGKTGSI